MVHLPLLLWAAPAAATLTLLWIVPEMPLAHLDDPSHWGMLAYLAFLPLLWRATWRRHARVPRTLLAAFLVGMPMVYLANWLRHGGSGEWLAIELLGLALFGALALYGLRRDARWLAVGIAGHAIWDAWHLEGVTFVPGWYATGCAVIDVAVGGFAAALCLLSTRRSE